MEKKLTKKEKFAMVMEYVTDNAMLVEFLQNEINLLEKKSSSSAKSKNQIENENIKLVIVDLLKSTGLKYTITDFQNAFEEMKGHSNQKLSALFTQLCKEDKIERIVDKKKTYFKANI